MNHHTLAAVSIAGSCLDVLGSVYLAYDLLGGQHGPLRLLTRAVTYTIIYGIFYGLGLGLYFGVVAGSLFGATAAIEINRESEGKKPYALRWQAMFSVIRAFGFGLALYPMTGLPFAAAFAALNAAGQVVGYSRGIRPGMDYSAARRPRLSRRQFWATVVRTFAYTAAAMACSFLAPRMEHPFLLALRIGLVTGIATGVSQTIGPYVEYFADNLPERRMGAFGIGLILCGFALQSVQYWVALFDIRVV